jgi:hypothetical protein
MQQRHNTQATCPARESMDLLGAVAPARGATCARDWVRVFVRMPPPPHPTPPTPSSHEPRHTRVASSSQRRWQPGTLRMRRGLVVEQVTLCGWGKREGVKARVWKLQSPAVLYVAGAAPVSAPGGTGARRADCAADCADCCARCATRTPDAAQQLVCFFGRPARAQGLRNHNRDSHIRCDCFHHD